MTEQEYRDVVPAEEEQQNQMAAEEEQEEQEAGEEVEAEEGEGEEQEEEEQPKPKKKSAQQRIRELTAKYRQTQRELEELKRLQQQVSPQQYAQADHSQQLPQKPKRDDFDDEDAYLDAYADWKVEVKMTEKEQQQQKQSEQQQQQQEQEKFNQAIQQINQKGLENFEDYEDVVLDNNELPITQDMARSIAEMENGHMVAYHLGKNPQKAADIAQKSPYQQAIQLAKLEDQFSKGTQTKKKTKSKAPPPTNSVNASGEKSDPEPEDINEWMKWRRRQLANKQAR